MCVDCYPFNTFQVGDYIEVDTDKTSAKKDGDIFGDTNMVRKFVSSNEVVSRNNNNLPSISRNQALDIGRTLDAMVEQSGGQNEYEFRIESPSKDIRYSIVSRRK